jgi:hypothetical protein
MAPARSRAPRPYKQPDRVVGTHPAVPIDLSDPVCNYRAVGLYLEPAASFLDRDWTFSLPKKKPAAGLRSAGFVLLRGLGRVSAIA